jgi:hypothetical protein
MSLMPPMDLLQLVHLALQGQGFLLRQLLEAAFRHRSFQVLEALDGQLQRLEVGHHAAQPAVIDVGHAATLGFLGDDLARLALGADEQDGALLGRHLADESDRLLVLGSGSFRG